jgi:hypothetical protein
MDGGRGVLVGGVWFTYQPMLGISGNDFCSPPHHV